MVFGMPKALFPALAAAVFHGGPSTLGYLYAAPGFRHYGTARGSTGRENTGVESTGVESTGVESTVPPGTCPGGTG
jgi:hypothetical protein